MPKYIEFQTPVSDKDYEFSFGNPVHNGKVPSRFREVTGIRVDGEPLVLADESIVHNLHKALVTMRGRVRKPFADCVSFAALMNGLALPAPEDNPLTNTRSDVSVNTEDLTVTDTLNLGVRHPYTGGFDYLHSVVPAHTPVVAQYLHKLGYEGPICLSSLEDAMSMYDCTVAHPIVLE